MNLLSQESLQVLLSISFAYLGAILILIMLCTKAFFFFRKKNYSSEKSSFIPLIGVSFISALTVIANNSFIYAIALIIVATLITELEFLEKLMALLWNRKDYWQFQEFLAMTKVTQQTSDDPTKTKKELRAIEKGIGSDGSMKPQVDEWFLPYHYERVYRQLFGTQLGLLQLLDLHRVGYAKFEIGEIYKKNPISASYPLENYLGFLENNKLIQFNQISNTYQITPIGQSFLKYLSDNQIPPIRPN